MGKEFEEFTFMKGIKWVFIVGLFLLIATVILNLFGVIGSAATAPGRVLNKTLETNNIIHNYEWFYDVNASYEAKIGQISQFKEFYETEKDAKEKRHIRIEMAAIQQVCRDLTEKYNANSSKMNRSIFKGWNLPEVLNQSACE